MFKALKSYSTGKLFLLLPSSALLLGSAALISLGGWESWSASQSAPLAVSQARETVRSESPAPKPAPFVETKPLVLSASPIVPAAEPAKTEEVRKKEPPKGAKHAQPPGLLHAMMLQLHSVAYQQFIQQPGMGDTRRVPTFKAIPREWKMPEWTSEELAKEPPPPAGVKDLESIHRTNIKTFAASNAKAPKDGSAANPRKDGAKELNWEIKSLDLVGLVMHEAPVVYTSDKVVKMNELSKSQTRELDLFESEGLEELVNGKELYVRGKEGTIRVLGPVRAAKACLQCHHESKEGDMLGAFSYTLRLAQYRHQGNPPIPNLGGYFKNPKK